MGVCVYGKRGVGTKESLRFCLDSNLSKYILDCSAVGACDFGSCEATRNLGAWNSCSAFLWEIPFSLECFALRLFALKALSSSSLSGKINYDSIDLIRSLRLVFCQHSLQCKFTLSFEYQHQENTLLNVCMYAHMCLLTSHLVPEKICSGTKVDGYRTLKRN